MEKDFNKTTSQGNPGDIAPQKHKAPSLTIDYDLYQKYLDGSDMSEEQKHEFLDALWSIIVSLVDLGFGVHPLQQASPDANGPGTNGDVCGQLDIPADFFPAESGDMIKSQDQSRTQTENTTDRQSGPLQEGSRK